MVTVLRRQLALPRRHPRFRSRSNRIVMLYFVTVCSLVFRRVVKSFVQILVEVNSCHFVFDHVDSRRLSANSLKYF